MFETASTYFHGIKWEIEIVNPGSVPVEIIRSEFGIQNVKSGKSSIITGLPAHDIYDTDGALATECGFFMRPNQLEKRTLVIYYDEFEREMIDMIGVSDRRFILYFDLGWLSKGREQFRSVQSAIFYLPKDGVFGLEVKWPRLT